MESFTDQEDIIIDAYKKWISLALYTGATALFCFDYSITIGSEVRLIWPRRLSGPSILFYTVRYPALLNTLFVILNEVLWRGISNEVNFCMMYGSYLGHI
ncbi:hypothetical protein C8Q74DRAFT_213959 [Fomes fomentarius]|nr:hypothetical protein C8Q74DRAFT_213959 [Fomes fomentarius]